MNFDKLIINIIFKACAKVHVKKRRSKAMKTKQYLLTMSSIILIMILLGVSFAWYTSNTNVGSEATTIYSATTEGSTLSFVFDSDDYSAGKLYYSDLKHLTDPYGRDKYQGQTGANDAGVITLTDGKITDNDYAYTLYYQVKLQNTATTAKTVNFSINNIEIFKSTSNSSANKKLYLNLNGSDAYVEDANLSQYVILTSSVRDTKGTADDETDDTTYTRKGSYVYDQNGALVGHVGEKVEGDKGQFQISWAKLNDDGTYISGTQSTEISSKDAIEIAGASSDGQIGTATLIIAIKYFNGESKFAYSDISYMGAWFNFEISVSEVETNS